jgi:hypothetical protein
VAQDLGKVQCGSSRHLYHATLPATP